MAGHSRIERARARARTAKAAVASAALLVFGVAFVGAKIHAPGHVKGKAKPLDAAAELIAGEGFVSAGGDIAVRGPVDVALPHGGAIRVVEGGLATSGTASRGRHLVDPRTGTPSDSQWEQITASGSSCLAADVAAKVAFLLGADGPAWLDDRGIAGRFVTRDREIVESALWRGALACT